jgi:DNA polymerase-4
MTICPDILLGLELQEIYGIGERMEQRLHRAGIFTVAELWQASPMRLRRVWGGINGLLFHQMLHGVDIQPPSSRFSKSMGHQHVLEPELRTNEGAGNFARHLLTKAAERLRRGDYYCRRLGLHLSAIAAGITAIARSRVSTIRSISPQSARRHEARAMPFLRSA